MGFFRVYPSSASGNEYEALHKRSLNLQREVDKLSILREITLSVISSLDLNDALRNIADVVQGALEVRKVAIYELRKKENVFRPLIIKTEHSMVTEEDLEDETIPRKGSYLGDVLDSRQVTVIQRDHQCDAYVPLIAKHDPIGVLHLQDRIDEQSFDQADRELFKDMASPISIALYNAQLYALAVTDGLTGLYVRRYFDLRMEEEFAESLRYGRHFTLMMFDIDHFKKFNDTHGHQTGDMVLRQFAKLLQKNTRAVDICCRYGGEEMAIILTNTPVSDGLKLAEKICEKIRTHAFLGVGDKKLKVTSSIGVADYSPDYDSPSEMVEAADKALYRAKEGGRDRVECAPSS